MALEEKRIFEGLDRRVTNKQKTNRGRASAQEKF